MQDKPIAQEFQLLTTKTLAKRLSLSTRQIHRLNQCEILPEPLRISGSLRWQESTIQEWLAKKCPKRAKFEATIKEGDK